jgi:D-amino-acid dehydrogenase
MSERAERVVVVGGGVIGLACAYYLLRAGCRVTLLDRGPIGGACSHGNCGLVCPSHVLPLAEPGVVGKALRALFQPNSPLTIRPRLDWRLWSWLWNFARRANEPDMLAAARGCQALLESSLALYKELFALEGLDCEFETRGLLFAFRTPQGFAEYAHTERLLATRFALPARRIEGQELVEFEPALRPGLAGGYYYERDAHLRPDRLMSAWRQAFERRGGEVLERREFLGFRAAGQRAEAVQTDRGELEADACVVATGAWTPLLARQLGVWLPIEPGKGYSLTMPRPALCPRMPLLLMEDRVAVTPFRSGYRLGSTMEFAGYDDSLRPERLELLRRGAARFLREPYCEPVEEAWYGWRPMTYDGLPVIDRSPRLANVLLAAGHNMLGLSMAPATGRLVAALVTGEEVGIDPAPYRAARFV